MRPAPQSPPPQSLPHKPSHGCLFCRGFACKRMGGQAVNQLSLSARVLEIRPLRHTPAGQPVLEMQLRHESEVLEAGTPRSIALEMPAVAVGDVALMLAETRLDTALLVSGFLTPRSRNQSGKLVLHIQQARRNHT